LRIGDDGTGLDAPALSWLHINCGVSCHNANENADGYGAGMLLRLDPTLLDGTPATSSWDPLRTTLNVACVSGSVAGQPRIVPGNQAASALVHLISERGVLQMPPIASRVIDSVDVASVVDWIQHMPLGDGGLVEAGGGAGRQRSDSGSPDAAAGVEAGSDAASSDDSTSDDSTSDDSASGDDASGDDASGDSQSSSDDGGAD
jgi:hypothetical protein